LGDEWNILIDVVCFLAAPRQPHCYPQAFAAMERVLTPSATESPFYPHHLPLNTDNDPVAIMPEGQKASGQIFHLMGRITDQSGMPRQGDRIEIWQ
jgi:protocatechuate 3,4-dioxygenase, beta subunit